MTQVMNPLSTLPLPGVALVCALLLCSTAQADIVITGKRVLFQAPRADVTVQLNNTGSQPLLIQSWLDDGDVRAAPDTPGIPFLVVPSVMRMEPGQGVPLRVITNGAESLPTVRESLFWLNVLEVPPEPQFAEGEEKNTLQFAFRTRIKFFYRPAGLPYESARAWERMNFSLVRDDAAMRLQVQNPTPYHVTFVGLALVREGDAQPLFELKGKLINGRVLEPYSDMLLPLDGLNALPAAGTTVEYGVLDDYAAYRKKTRPLVMESGIASGNTMVDQQQGTAKEQAINGREKTQKE